MIDYLIAAVIGGVGLLFGLAAFTPDAGATDRLYFVMMAGAMLMAALTVAGV